MKALDKRVPDFFGYMKPASSCCEAAIVSHSVGSGKAWLACSRCHEKLEPTPTTKDTTPKGGQ